METWRIIPSLPEYLASSEGRIMRIPYVAEMPKGGTRQYGGLPWAGVWEAGAGRYVFLFMGKTRRVARVVCEAFNGPPPFKEAVAMHLDEDSSNNAPHNLGWGTQKENLNMPKVKAYHRARGFPVAFSKRIFANGSWTDAG